MAVNETRNLNGDLADGITDGMVKKVNPNRGGFPNDDDQWRDTYAAVSNELYDPVSWGGYRDEVARRYTRL
jgi:hypothetical protein